VTKHTPATPLPWTHQATRKPMMPLVAANGEWISSPYNRVGDIEDFEYIAHAANAYPKLVAALRTLTALCDNVPVFQLDDGKASVKAVRLAGKFTDAHRVAAALLRELGEE
jgi:hypothetical protein